MKITDVTTYLVSAASPTAGGWAARNWLFTRVDTDAGIHGIGEGSGWPRVVETAVEDLKPILIGEDPLRISRLWQKMLVAIMGHGMTGVVGSGALTAIEMALFDIKGKALGVPVCDLLGGRLRDTVPVYAHAHTAEKARDLVDRGYTALKTGGVRDAVRRVEEIREAVGPDIDLMVDLHGPPYATTADAIAIGKRLEPFDLLFYEDPVPPEEPEALARVRREVALPIAAGERHPFIWGVRDLIVQRIVDVIQPDTGRAGGLLQMQKIAALAEAHGIMMAPHDGSLGPVAEMAAVHLLAAIPNALILEHLEDDVPQRYTVMSGQPTIADCAIAVPIEPGLGIDLVVDEIEKHPSSGNVSPPDSRDDFVYRQALRPRARGLSGGTGRSGYRAGSVF